MHVLYVAVFVAVIFTCNARKHYDGYQILSIEAESLDQLRLLREISQNEEFDFWSEPSRGGIPVEVMVAPQDRARLVAFLREHDFQFSTLVEDMEKNIESEMKRLNSRRDSAGKMSYDFNDYNDYDAMMQQLEDFVDNCTDPLNCSLQSIGNSYEGRELTMMKITTAADDTSRRGYWFDSLIHAREWLAGTSTMNIINHLLTEYLVDEDVTYLLDTYNFYFLPVLNPDGYVYSWESEREWRKSRNINEGSECIGTDLNRNFAYSWGTDGTNEDPCANNYGGTAGGSEPETQVVQAMSETLAAELDGWLAVHTAANMWLHPFGNTKDGVCERSADYDHQNQVAEAAAVATMAEYNTTWTYGTICETIYPASGGSIDYTYGVSGIKYSYGLELRGPSFDPPPSMIEPGWREFWAGFVGMVKEIESLESY